MTDSISFEELLAQQMESGDFRDHWERTVLARSVADQVIRYRIDHKLSQRALAELLGVSQAVVGRLELGEHEPKISTLSRLSRKLGVTFNIDIHPVNRTEKVEDLVVSRTVADGVELVVTSS